MQNPQNLEIWRRSIELAVDITAMARSISGLDAPGLANQIRRASSSIPANIAEGVGHNTPKETARFLSIAIASAFELESHLILIGRPDPSIVECDRLLDELRQIRRMTYSYRRHKMQESEKQKRRRDDRPAT
ncbi:MAG: four helix bundle protein [Gemmatimonadaceae bacterium]|nr:four helix bundle protein [Gemmatimonadaceae bacterium]